MLLEQAALDVSVKRLKVANKPLTYTGESVKFRLDSDEFYSETAFYEEYATFP